MPRGIPNSKSADETAAAIPGVSMDASVDTLTADPAESQANSEPPVGEEPVGNAQPAAKHVGKAVTRPWMSGNKVEITVHSGESDQSKLEVFVSVNDYEARFPRDLAVILPEEAAACITEAVFDHLVRDAAGGIVNKPIRRFQYTVHRFIPKVEA